MASGTPDPTMCEAVVELVVMMVTMCEAAVESVVMMVTGGCRRRVALRLSL